MIKKSTFFTVAASLILLIDLYFMLSTIEFPDIKNVFYVTRDIDTSKFNTEQGITFGQFTDRQALKAQKKLTNLTTNIL